MNDAAHWHEWVRIEVKLSRDKALSNGSRDSVIYYKRCKRCGKVLL